jgi:RNA ligase (TIGR02306 family)
MSTFECKVVTVSIQPHPDADRLDVAIVGGYKAIVGKGTFSNGDAAVYIPEDSVVPDWLLEKMNLVGKLAGSKHNRVKAMRLRGIFSQGLVYPLLEINQERFLLPIVEDGVDELVPVQLGDDVKDYLGVTKYEPEIPIHMAGEVLNIGEYGIHFDVENIKKYPNVLQIGEMVRMTEKVHGTFMGVGIVPKKDANDELLFGRIVVFSKGIGANGLGFKSNDQNKDNLYLRASLQHGIAHFLLDHFPDENDGVYIFSEVFGKGVQDLHYGADAGVQVRVIGGARGHRGQLHFSRDVYQPAIDAGILQEAPVLYEGPYSPEMVELHTNGKESVSGKATHVREGVVIVSVPERYTMDLNPLGGRVMLKSVSEAYIDRKNATEYQ